MERDDGVPSSGTLQFPTETVDDCPVAEEENSDVLPNGAFASSPIRETDAMAKLQIGSSGGGRRGSSSDESDCFEDAEGEELWKFEDESGLRADCFVCGHSIEGIAASQEIKNHIETLHDLSFDKLKRTFKMGHLGFVQFVSWAKDMKKQGRLDECLKKLYNEPLAEKQPWQCAKYLEEPDTDDCLLTLGFFEFEEQSGEANQGVLYTQEELQAWAQNLQEEKQLMREVFARVLDVSSEMGSNCTKLLKSSRADSATSVQERAAETRLGNRSRQMRHNRLHESLSQTHTWEEPSQNALYFESYDDVSIHHEMIFDNARTDAYLVAINERCEDIRGKVVMDVGCGTGILSMFCCRHEPRMVYAVDKSNIIFEAMSNSFENNFDSKICFLHKDIDNDNMTELRGKVDVLVSEFMGYFLFFEGMTETFIRARDKFLKESGIMLPDSCSVELVPLGREGIYQRKVDCWNDVYGFKMPAVKAKVMNETLIDVVGPNDIIGEAVVVKTLDLRTCSVQDVSINSSFIFKFTKNEDFCAVAGYFFVGFEGVNNKVILSTSPRHPPTHWKQAIFFLNKPRKVVAGQEIHGNIFSYPHQKNPRWIVVDLTFEGETQRFEFR